MALEGRRRLVRPAAIQNDLRPLSPPRRAGRGALGKERDGARTHAALRAARPASAPEAQALPGQRDRERCRTMDGVVLEEMGGQSRIRNPGNGDNLHGGGSSPLPRLAQGKFAQNQPPDAPEAVDGKAQRRPAPALPPRRSLLGWLFRRALGGPLRRSLLGRRFLRRTLGPGLLAGLFLAAARRAAISPPCARASKARTRSAMARGANPKCSKSSPARPEAPKPGRTAASKAAAPRREALPAEAARRFHRKAHRPRAEHHRLLGSRAAGEELPRRERDDRRRNALLGEQARRR